MNTTEPDEFQLTMVLRLTIGSLPSYAIRILTHQELTTRG